MQQDYSIYISPATMYLISIMCRLTGQQKITIHFLISNILNEFCHALQIRSETTSKEENHLKIKDICMRGLEDHALKQEEKSREGWLTQDQMLPRARSVLGAPFLCSAFEYLIFILFVDQFLTLIHDLHA